MGGNKTRQLEFVMADVQQKGYDAVISTAGSQSNWCCQLAAAARRLGMEAAFVLYSGLHPERQGNLLLHSIMGSEIRILEGQTKIVNKRVVRTGNYASNASTVMDELAREFRKRGRNPVILNPSDIQGQCMRLQICGWVEAAEEICQQLEAQKINSQYIVCCEGSGATQAGLILGIKLLSHSLEVIGISVSRPKVESVERIIIAANQVAEFLGLGVSVTPDEVTVFDDYIGESIGVMTEECLEAIKLTAQTEGIFIDPVYTGKGMAGLIDLIRRGRFNSNDTVIFIHSGGVPALFAYAHDKEFAK